MPRTVEQLVADAKRRVRSAGPDEVAEAILAGRALVVDVREPDEFERGRIPGSVNVPRGWLEFRADPACPVHDERLAPERPLVVCCAIGGRSALAAAALEELGYAEVTNLEGGFEAWKAAGYTVEPGEVTTVA